LATWKVRALNLFTAPREMGSSNSSSPSNPPPSSGKSRMYVFIINGIISRHVVCADLPQLLRHWSSSWFRCQDWSSRQHIDMPQICNYIHTYKTFHAYMNFTNMMFVCMYPSSLGSTHSLHQGWSGCHPVYRISVDT
jgi:hypothetical protein